MLRALHEYHVLAVRDQDLVPATLQQVARRFGPFSGNPVHTPMDGFEDIVRFVRERDDTGKVIGEDWHMDLAWLAKPPGVTMLYGEEVPPVGGDTCFTSLEKAYQSLSPRLVAILEGLTGIHSGRGVFAINAMQKRLGVTADVAAIENAAVEHPVICAHPVTGRRYVVRQQRPDPFQGHDGGGEQAADRLPAGQGDAAGVSLPPALGAAARSACGTTPSCCTPRSTTIQAIAG